MDLVLMVCTVAGILPPGPERIKELVKKFEEPLRADGRPGPPDGPWPTFNYRWHGVEIGQLKRAREAAVPALLALLEDKTKPGQARAHAAVVLADRLVGTKVQPDPKIIAAINAALKEGDPALSHGVLVELFRRGLAGNREIREWIKKDEKLVELAKSLPPPEEVSFTPAVMDALLPEVVAALADKHPEVAIDAARTIVRFGRPKTGVPDLIAALGREEVGVRRAAALALGEVGRGDPVALKATLGELDPSRYGEDHYGGILTAVGRFGPDAKDAVPALIEAVKDDRWARKDSDGRWSWVYEAAIAALGEIGPAAKPGVPAALARMHDPAMSYGARLRIIDALDKIDPAAGKEARAREAAKQEEFKRLVESQQTPPTPAVPPALPIWP